MTERAKHYKHSHKHITRITEYTVINSAINKKTGGWGLEGGWGWGVRRKGRSNKHSKKMTKTP